MIAGREGREDAWRWGAAALTAGLWALLCCETLLWHPGYAHGDESDVVAFLQRVREGMPWRWVLANGSLHKSLLYAALSLWPGRLWVTSLPALLAWPLEAALLFALGRRLGGARAGFFAVLAGLCTAFSLLRGRSGLALGLFPIEWLGLCWLRLQCRRPWAWALWGALLGLCLFDYEAWLPMALLFLLLPVLEPLPLGQRLWELAGLLLLLALLLPPTQVMEHLERRRAASLAISAAGSGSAGWRGLFGLIVGAKTVPYLAPFEHGVLPFWSALALPLGLRAWPRKPWAPLACLLLGVALVLAGGAPYGLPAHRFIAAWPAVALLAGLGLDAAFAWLPSPRSRQLLALALTLACAQQLLAWEQGQRDTDADLHGPIRNLKAAADAAWQQSQRQGWPLVTELHPLKGPQFRYLVGVPVPLPEAGARNVVAYLPWEYLPALRGLKLPVATFQEQGGRAPGLVVLLSGAQAAQALETERALRPLMTQAQLFSLPSRALIADWLAKNPKAPAWARTEALDYGSYIDLHTGRYSLAEAQALQGETLLSARPLILAARCTAASAPELSLQILARARGLDPHNCAAWDLAEEGLRARGRLKEAQDLQRQADALDAQGQLLCD